MFHMELTSTHIRIVRVTYYFTCINEWNPFINGSTGVVDVDGGYDEHFELLWKLKLDNNKHWCSKQQTNCNYTSSSSLSDRYHHRRNDEFNFFVFFIGSVIIVVGIVQSSTSTSNNSIRTTILMKDCMKDLKRLIKKHMVKKKTISTRKETV